MGLFDQGVTTLWNESLYIIRVAQVYLLPEIKKKRTNKRRRGKEGERLRHMSTSRSQDLVEKKEKVWCIKGEIQLGKENPPQKAAQRQKGRTEK